MSEKLNNSNENNSENNSNFNNNTNIQNRIENIFPLSPLIPNNVSSFQNWSYYATPKPLDNTINNTSEQQDSSKQQNNCNSNKETEQIETPKMNYNFSQNDHIAEIISNKEKDSNNKPKDEKNNISIETKNTSNINIINQITPIPVIQNIVSTVDLGCPINLKEIALQAQNTQYIPNKFSGLIMRIKEPKATALIFSTGKMVCLGAKTEEESKNACRKFGKILKNLNYPISLKKFKIENIVSSCNVKFKIPLCKLSNHIKKYLGAKRISYEPEVFPGLIYHYYNDIDNNSEENGGKSNIVFLIFSSGNIVIAGAKNRNEIYDKFDKLFPLLDKFRDNKK